MMAGDPARVKPWHRPEAPRTAEMPRRGRVICFPRNPGRPARPPREPAVFPSLPRCFVASAALLPLVLAACGQTTASGTTDEVDDESDQDPPQIVVEQVEHGQPTFEPVTVRATVTDESEVSSVRLWYHNVNSAQDIWVSMEIEGDAAAGVYAADIPGEDVTGSKVYYYVEACDDARPSNCGTSPGAGDYFEFNVE